MGLGAKLNTVLVCVFAVGVALFYFLSGPFLNRAAEDEVLTRARIMMEGAAGVRKYTAEEIAPLLTRQMKKGQFHPQSVAAYAATKNFAVLRQQFPEYSYREVALNPTNPASKAIDWEADIINNFRDFPAKHDLVTHRSTAQGQLLHLSRPIVAGEMCLLCHGRPSDAPRSMLASYGEQHVVVLNPITRMSHVASEVSMGKTGVPEYHSRGSDEIASLSASFNRMRRTVEEAMKLLSDSLK